MDLACHGVWPGGELHSDPVHVEEGGVLALEVICASGERVFNSLFVGTDHAGENLAGLNSLIATCEANDLNPVAYLADG